MTRIRRNGYCLWPVIFGSQTRIESLSSKKLQLLEIIIIINFISSQFWSYTLLERKFILKWLMYKFTPCISNYPDSLSIPKQDVYLLVKYILFWILIFNFGYLQSDKYECSLKTLNIISSCYFWNWVLEIKHTML